MRCDIAGVPRLKPITGTRGYRSLVFRVYMNLVISPETVYNIPSESVTDLIRDL